VAVSGVVVDSGRSAITTSWMVGGWVRFRSSCLCCVFVGLLLLCWLQMLWKQVSVLGVI